MMSKAAARAVMVQAVNGNPIRLLLRWHHCCFSTAAIFGSIPQSRTIALALLSSSSTTAPVRLLLHTGRLNSKSNCFSTTTPLAATSEPHSLSLSLPALLREAYGAVGAIAIAFLALAAATGTSLSKEETSTSSSTAAATPILRTTTQCNGIVGIVGSQENAREFLLHGLHVLRHRGYDSVGIATLESDTGRIAITKFADTASQDSMDLIEQHSKSQTQHSTASATAAAAARVGLAHTRWATQGARTDANAHPHTDTSGKIALVHNGTINNAAELRRELKLQQPHYQFHGTADSEVLAKLVGFYYEQAVQNDSQLLKTATPGALVKLAVEYALSRCDGTWGLCVLCSDAPNELVVACNGSPMLLGLADDCTLVASETAALRRYTQNYIAMKDGEIGLLHATERTLDLTRAQRVPKDWLLDADENDDTPPAPFPHWTLKEIYEQPEAIARALGYGGRLAADKIALGGLDKNFDRLSTVKYVALTGCGTSLHAARYGEKLMKQLTSFDRVVTVDATELEESDLPCPDHLEETGLIVVSQSGETKTLAHVVEHAIAKNITTMSVVNAVGSLIARTVHLGVYCNAGRENGVVSTKAFTSQVVSLALIALWFRQTRDLLEGRRSNSVDTMRLKEALMRLPISFGMALKLRDKCRKVAERLHPKEHCFVLGKGFAEPIAMEGALKIKEMGYLHAEGCSGGALKHGPFALIESDETGKMGATPIILLILDDQHAQLMRTAGEETKARGAELFVITDKAELAEGLDDNPLIIPNNGPLTGLGAILPLQLIAYELAILRGHNPDTPRNLSKVFSS